MFRDCVDYLLTEWRVLRQAPLSFVILVGFSIVISGAGWFWYFKDRLDVLEQENDRLGRALGIGTNDNVNPLIRLTNKELCEKGTTAVRIMRSIVSYHNDQNTELNSKRRKREVTDIQFQELREKEQTRASEEFTDKVKVEAIRVLDELTKRVPVVARGQIGLPRLNPADKRDPSVSLHRVIPSPMDVGFAPLLADNIEELCKALPDR